jgi:CheY-like chemotaxis protein
MVTRRVLVTDDNQDAAETLAILLGLDGHDTRVANNSRSAIEISETFRPEVAILDINMPGGMSGYDLARYLKNMLGEKLVLIALTGLSQTQDRQRARLAGFAHHLVKPASYEELKAIL